MFEMLATFTKRHNGSAGLISPFNSRGKYSRDRFLAIVRRLLQ